MRTSFLIAVAFAVPASTFAQHDAHGPTIAGRIPLEIVNRPVPVRTGIGAVRHPTSAKSAEAQRLYEQGLAYLHSYVFLEAARSFNQALREDSTFALAWVGLSRAFTGLEDATAASEAQQKAVALAGALPVREQKWIEARSKQLASLADRTSVEKRDAYRASLDAALEADPTDAELWTLRGNFEEPTLWAAGRGQRGSASSIAFYERAIALVPGHFGAHHYLIHSNEMIGQFDEALRHGKIYADAASAVPHALHMYGHDLMKVGRTTEAIAIFERARTLEHEYYDNERISRDFDWHHAHNTSLLALTYRHEGKLDTAERLLRDAATVGQSSQARIGYYRGVVTDVLLSRGKTDEALASARSMIESTDPSTRTLGHALAARALLVLGRTSDLAPHLAGMRSDDAGFYDFTGLQSQLARGESLLRSGRDGDAAQGTKALDDLIARARLQRTPDGWIEGLYFLEAVFAIAQRADQPALAVRAAQALMAHDKAYGGSHYAAGLLARAAGDAAAAARSFSEAARLWKDADADFAAAREAKRR